MYLNNIQCTLIIYNVHRLTLIIYSLNIYTMLYCTFVCTYESLLKNHFTFFSGRLNVLANVARKPLEQIFCQFNPQLSPEDEVSY